MFTSLTDIEFNPNKILVHFDRIKDIAEGKPVNPVVLELDISSYCDHSCKWCVDPNGSHTNTFMPVQMAEKILAEAKELNIKGVVFKGGGESTLHPECHKILEIANSFKFETGLVTNGSHLHRNNITDALINYCSYVRISIDGPTEDSRSEIHGTGDFHILTNNIRQLVSLRNKKRHPVIGGTFCLDYSKKDLIQECIQLGENIKLDYLLIRPPFCEEVGFISPDTPEEKKLLRDKMYREAEKYSGPMQIFIGNWIGDKESENAVTDSKFNLARRDTGIRKQRYNGIEHITGRCLAQELTLVITADGEVYGCCCLRGIKPFMFGKIDYAKGESIGAILNSDRRRSCLNQMRQTKCLKYCTHPLSKINEVIEYLKVPEKYHSSFI